MMTKERLREFLILLSIMAVLTALAIVGMLQIFNAADEARHNIEVSQCQTIILGKSIHDFHVSFAKIEAKEGTKNAKERLALIQRALNEPDLALAMRKCEEG